MPALLSRLPRTAAAAVTMTLAAFLVLFSASGTASARATPYRAHPYQAHPYQAHSHRAHPYLTKLAQAQAASQLRAAGVAWWSSGGCTTRGNPSCTSFERINRSTVRGVIALRWASNCAITITGGTEVGHGSRARGRHSHYNGYKVDVRHNRCLDRYLHRSFRYLGLRGDGYPQWRTRSGNLYCDEGSHWDVTYLTCGC